MSGKNQRFNYLNALDSPDHRDKKRIAQVRHLLGELILYALRRGVVLAAIYFGGMLAAAAAEPARPEFDVVARAAADYFHSLPDYQQGDLVSQKHLAAALNRVAEVGWEVPGREQIQQRALADGSFLVRELSTPAGRKFMRRIAGTPGGYERLERLSSISGGQRTVRDLMHQRGGDELIEYLATTPGGRNLGRMMARAKNGVNLNKPTGRIYTADEFIAALKKVYHDSAP